MATQKKVFAAPLLCDLTDELGKHIFRWLCIGAKRDVLVLSKAKPPTHNRFLLESEPQFRISHWHNGSVKAIDLAPSDQLYSYGAVVGENYLYVAARCAPEELNAHLFNVEGGLLHSWHAGDGIEDVQVSPNGQIWVSYFDQGVLDGWGNDTSGQGLVCFDAQGQRIFGFYSDAVLTLGSQVDSILDCYALNVVSNRDVWVWYYPNSPLLHLRDHKVKEVFETPPEMRGTYALAVCGTRRLFVGGYQNGGQIFWRDEADRRQFEIEVTDEEGASLEWNRVCGRGADLFLCNQAVVHMLSLNEINF